VKVGLIISKTGPQAPVFAPFQKYIQARLDKANQTHEVPGVHFDLIVDDDQSTPAGEMAAATDLVANKHVFGIIEASALGFAAYRYLVQQKVPVVAAGFDGPEYGDPANVNLFPYWGSFDPKYHSVTTFAHFLKGQGVTKLAVLGVGDSPSATGSAKVTAASARNAGISVPYLNTSVTFATSDFTQVAVEMKQAGVNGLALYLQSNQNVSLITALKQDGVRMKAILVDSGYGTDTTSDPAATAALQGADFDTIYPPVELGTAGVKAFQADLQKYAKASGDPGFAASIGWFTTDIFVTGVKLAGKPPTPAAFIKNLRKVTDYNPYGLLATGFNFTQFGKATNGLAPGNCFWVSKLVGKIFEPIKGAAPMCGSNIPNSDQVG
jgi:branched-chain amino acid transport system substrate-binding protein